MGKLDPNRCIAETSDPPYYLHTHQCSRKRGHGSSGAYCKQHAKIEAERTALMTRNRQSDGR